MTLDLVFWAMFVAAVVHVAEEYWGGWIDWARRLVPGVTRGQFLAVNALFLALSLSAALAGRRHLTFSLSVAALLLVNAAVHLVPAARLGRYVPGALSAALLYLPLGIHAFHLAWRHLTVASGVAAVALGVAWMAVPVAFQWLRLLVASRGRG